MQSALGVASCLPLLARALFLSHVETGGLSEYQVSLGILTNLENESFMLICTEKNGYWGALLPSPHRNNPRVLAFWLRKIQLTQKQKKKKKTMQSWVRGHRPAITTIQG